MGASDARGRDVGEAVIAALHPFAPLGTSGGFDRGAGRLDISSRTLRKLRSSTRIECDDRVNVSPLGNALAGRPKWVAGRPHRETRSGAW